MIASHLLDDAHDPSDDFAEAYEQDRATREGYPSVITVDMIEACRDKHDSVIVADSDDRPVVRSAIHHDHPSDPLYDGSGGQILVLRADDLAGNELDDTDQDVADDLTARWQQIVDDARARAAGF